MIIGKVKWKELGKQMQPRFLWLLLLLNQKLKAIIKIKSKYKQSEGLEEVYDCSTQ